MPISTTEELGRLVRAARKQQGLSQEALAGASGVGPRFIVELDKGKPTCEIGRLEQTLVGKMSFGYVDDAARAISLSMPARAAPYDDDACEAYFGGLLPESEPARVVIGRHFGANPNNNFSLLRVTFPWGKFRGRGGGGPP